MKSREYTVEDIQDCLLKVSQLSSRSLLKNQLSNHLLMLKKNLGMNPPRRMRFLALNGSLKRGVTEKEVDIVSDVIATIGVTSLNLSNNDIGECMPVSPRSDVLDIFIRNKHQINELNVENNELHYFTDIEWNNFMEQLQSSSVMVLGLDSNSLDSTRLEHAKAIVALNSEKASEQNWRRELVNNERGLARTCALFYVRKVKDTAHDNINTTSLPAECSSLIAEAERINSLIK